MVFFDKKYEEFLEILKLLSKIIEFEKNFIEVLEKKLKKLVFI